MRSRTSVLVLALVAAAAAAAGCGDGSSSSPPSGTSAATPPALLRQAADDVAAATRPPTSFADWSPGPGPAPEPGAKIGILTCLNTVPACVRGADTMKEAADALGWDAVVVDGTANVSNQRAALRTFLTANVRGFAMQAIDPHGISDLLKQAQQRRIPWVLTAGVDPRPFGGYGPSVDSRGGSPEQGRALGAWVANDSRGQADVLVMSSTDNPALQLRDDAFVKYLEQFPGIHFAGDPVYVPFKDVGPPLQAQAKSLIQANPELDYIYTPFDGYATWVVNAVQSLGSRVKVLGFDGNPQNVGFIRDGNAQVASAASAVGWCSWLAMDQLNRAMHGIPSRGSPACPGTVVDAETAPPTGVWDGDLDYQAEFERLWSR